MKITINNLDGSGGVDYSAALDAGKSLTIDRKLNEPSVCQLWLSLSRGSLLATPVRNAAIVVIGDDGTVYFTGYIAVSPLPEYAGEGLSGPRYRIAIQAVSDEILLDQAGIVSSSTVAGLDAGNLLASMVTRTGYTALSTTGLTSLSAQVGAYTPEAGALWSEVAAQVASMARSSYRALGGALTASTVGSIIHALDETAGSVQLASLTMSANVKRALANDVTVCGAEEPVAYATEFFTGDGTTTKFQMAYVPFFLTSSKSTLIHELFNESSIDSRYWYVSRNVYFSLGAGGLRLNGGAALDGVTVLSWNNPVEMGGTLLLESTGITLSPGSSGILSAFYSGTMVEANCTAGFQVTSASGTGAVSVQAFVNGVAAGQFYPINSTSQYVLRTRVHCAEMERVLPEYSTAGDDGVLSFGGGGAIATGRAQMEIQEFVNGVGATPVTLYDGMLGALSEVCNVVVASSLNLIGSIRSVNLTNLGSGWVVSTPSGGSAYSRRMGTTAEAGECYVTRTGYLEFYTGYAPLAGETVAVSYRTAGRAVGRAVNTASQAALAANGMSASAVWIGEVSEPAARSSRDCRNAATALMTAASSVSAAWSGTYKGWRGNFATDVWPGDALELTVPSASLDAQVVVRTVKVEYAASVPERVLYTITFANDWANDLAISTASTVPVDAWLPAVANASYLANLNQLTVTAVSGSVVSISAGVTPPTGGGFEVRRRDSAFQDGQDSDLVLRSPVVSFDVPRESQTDRFYIRMYDGNTPRGYSEFSAAVFVNRSL